MPRRRGRSETAAALLPHVPGISLSHGVGGTCEDLATFLRCQSEKYYLFPKDCGQVFLPVGDQILISLIRLWWWQIEPEDRINNYSSNSGKHFSL
jgi:hypothetical protein